MPNQPSNYISAIENDCPHITERLVYFWKRGADEFFAFATGLVTTENPDSQGLTEEVVMEILFLESIHDILYPRTKPSWAYV